MFQDPNSPQRKRKEMLALPHIRESELYPQVLTNSPPPSTASHTFPTPVSTLFLLCYVQHYYLQSTAQHPCQVRITTPNLQWRHLKSSFTCPGLPGLQRQAQLSDPGPLTWMPWSSTPLGHWIADATISTVNDQSRKSALNWDISQQSNDSSHASRNNFWESRGGDAIKQWNLKLLLTTCLGGRRKWGRGPFPTSSPCPFLSLAVITKFSTSSKWKTFLSSLALGKSPPSSVLLLTHTHAHTHE